MPNRGLDKDISRTSYSSRKYNNSTSETVCNTMPTIYKKPIKTSVLFAIVTVTTIASIMASPLAFSHQSLAQVPTNQVSGGGNGVMTCPDGSIVNVGSSFNSATDQNGQVISGGILLQTLQLPTLQKLANVTSATITPNGFTLTGFEYADAICGTAPGASVTLTGPCFASPGAAGTFQFTASNGEKATIQGNVECFIPGPPPPLPLTDLFKNQGQCIDFANHNPGNTLGVTKEACMKAFQNKFTNVP